MTTEGPGALKNKSRKKSYNVYEFFQYQMFAKYINKWRMRTLHLPRIHRTSMQNTIPKEKIPFSAMWSPSLLPRPSDWPEQCRVVGTCKYNPEKSNSNCQGLQVFNPIEAGFGDVIQWLNAGPKPIIIGFGSMIIDNTEKLANMIMLAAARAKCRILVQSGWSKIDVTSSPKGEDISDCNIRGPLCFNIGSCPHDWILPLCSATVHHGGAGTTATGLEHGLPTFICPFFADQFLWADKVYDAGVGPKYCPAKTLDVGILVNALKELQSPDMQLRAKKMSESMKHEDGIQGAMDHFKDFLPVDNMFCDVSMLMGEVRRARYILPGSNLKVSVEFAALIEMRKDQPSIALLQWLTEIGAFQMRRYAVTKYTISGGIRNFYEGWYYGIVGLLFQIVIQAPYKLFHLPNKYAFRYGAFGFCFGCIIGPFSMLCKLLYAILYFVDCVAVGLVNGCSSPDHHRDYICNRFREDNSYVYRLDDIENERTQIEIDGIEEQRVEVLLRAAKVAVDAIRIFNLSKPKSNLIHKIKEVRADDLCESVRLHFIWLMNRERKQRLISVLNSMVDKDERLSFSHFCKILNGVLCDEILKTIHDKKGNNVDDYHHQQQYQSKNEVLAPNYDFFHHDKGDDINNNNGRDEENQRRESSSNSNSIHIHTNTYKHNQQADRRNSNSSSLNTNNSNTNHTDNNNIRTSTSSMIHAGTMSLANLPIIRTPRQRADSSGSRNRGRTWSDGIATTIDNFSRTVAGGRVRSNSPKARIPGSNLGLSSRRNRTCSEEMKSGVLNQGDTFF